MAPSGSVQRDPPSIGATNAAKAFPIGAGIPPTTTTTVTTTVTTTTTTTNHNNTTINYFNISSVPASAVFWSLCWTRAR